MKNFQLGVALYVSMSGLYMVYNLFATFHPAAGVFLSKRDTSSDTASSLYNLNEQCSSYTSSSSSSSSSDSSSSVSDGNMRILSWNIKNGGMAGSSTPVAKVYSETEARALYWNVSGETSWSMRKTEMIENIKFYNPSIFTVQEALPDQMTDLSGAFSDYKYIGVGRDDGKNGGEHEAVFYKTSEFDLKHADHFWLSETPSKPSKYTGAGSPRLATVGNFVKKSNNAKFTLINTHMDDKSADARKFGAALIKYRSLYEYENFGGTVLLTGDFNSAPQGSGSSAYQLITGESKDDVTIPDDFKKSYKSNTTSTSVFKDFYTSVDFSKRLGHYSTATGFYKVGDTHQYQRIDFQMGLSVDDKTKWTVNKYMVPSNWYDVNRHLSDHRCVITDITLSA